MAIRTQTIQMRVLSSWWLLNHLNNIAGQHPDRIQRTWNQTLTARFPAEGLSHRWRAGVSSLALSFGLAYMGILVTAVALEVLKKVFTSLKDKLPAKLNDPNFLGSWTFYGTVLTLTAALCPVIYHSMKPADIVIFRA